MRAAPARRTKSEWIALLAEMRIRPSKALGQNFLVDPGIVDEILNSAGISEGDRIVELGPGLGILTEALVEQAGHVTAIELDRDLARILQQRFAEQPTVEIIEANALHVTAKSLGLAGSPYAIVANLPYSSGTAIIQHWLAQEHPPRRMTVMLQKEVAERIAAKPPGMSILAVVTQIVAVPTLVLAVPPSAFVPSPRVDSAVITLDLHEPALVPRAERAPLFALVNAGYRHKRKNLANSLSLEMTIAKSEVERLLNEVAIDPMRRAQTLSLDEWMTASGVFRRARPAG